MRNVPTILGIAFVAVLIAAGSATRAPEPAPPEHVPMPEPPPAEPGDRMAARIAQASVGGANAFAASGAAPHGAATVATKKPPHAGQEIDHRGEEDRVDEHPVPGGMDRQTQVTQ